MLRLLIGNRRYSSWSLRGWLALKHSGLPFETELLMFDTPAFAAAKVNGQLPAGCVPALWDAAGEVCVWDSLAILERCAEQPGVPAFWPEPPPARSFARSSVAEMHSGFAALREACPMDLLRIPAVIEASPEVRADISRIDTIWTQARDRFGGGGPFLFGEFGAADVMFAPVCARVRAYALPVGAASTEYVEAVLDSAWLHEWIEASRDEPTIDETRITASGPWRAPEA